MLYEPLAQRVKVPQTTAQTASRSFKFRSQHQERILAGTLVVNDALMIGLALWLAWYIRIGSGWLPLDVTSDIQVYFRAMLLAVAILLPIFAFSHLYSYNHLLGGPQEYSAVFRACSYGLIVLVFVSFLEHGKPLSRGWLIASWVCTVLLISTTRFFWRRAFLWLRRNQGWLTTRTLIVGADDQARAIARQLTSKNAGMHIVGFVDDFLPVGTVVMDDKSVLGSPTELHELAAGYGVGQVIVLPNAVAWETFQEIMQQSAKPNGFEIQLSPGFYEVLTTGVEVSQKAFVPLLRIEQSRITGLDLLMKKTVDFGLGTLLVLLTLPLMVAIGLGIKLSSGRPIIERQTVHGMGGVLFETRRFRTDLMGTVSRRLGTALPKGIGEYSATSTGVGHFLYRTGLDKLPQLFDILTGRMSLVGPRLISLGQEEALRPWLPNLLTVKPGWVGPWAVSGCQTQQEEIILDLYYVRNWTIWLDLQVIFQAMQRVLSASSRNNG